MRETPLRPGAPLLARHAGRFVKARVESILYAVDVNTMERRPADGLPLNGIGRAVVSTTLPLYLDPYASNRATGGLIFVEPVSNVTAGAAMIVAPVAGEAPALPAGVETRTYRVTGSGPALQAFDAELGPLLARHGLQAESRPTTG